MTDNPRKAVVLTPEAIEAQAEECFPTTGGGIVSWRTLLSAPQTATDSLTAGIAVCPPLHGHLCPHRHSHAEIYHITSGRGIVSIDGQEQVVVAGSVVYIPGDAEHGIRNVNPDEDLKWLYVFAADSFQDVVYRF